MDKSFQIRILYFRHTTEFVDAQLTTFWLMAKQVAVKNKLLPCQQDAAHSH